MTNKEVFEQYGSESWVVEENLHFLLQEFTEKLGVRPTFNTVGFIKNFMKEETIVEVEWAEKSKLDHLEKNGYIDGDFRELE